MPRLHAFQRSGRMVGFEAMWKYQYKTPLSIELERFLSDWKRLLVSCKQQKPYFSSLFSHVTQFTHGIRDTKMAEDLSLWMQYSLNHQIILGWKGHHSPPAPPCAGCPGHNSPALGICRDGDPQLWAALPEPQQGSHLASQDRNQILADSLFIPQQKLRVACDKKCFCDKIYWTGKPTGI